MKTVFKISVIVGVLITFVFAYDTYVELSKVQRLEREVQALKTEIEVLKTRLK